MNALNPRILLRPWPVYFRLMLCSVACLLAAAPAPATSVVPPEFDQLVNKADYVVRAVVRSVTSEFRTKGTQRKIYTRVELEVREVIAGTPPTPLVLEFLGGRVGDEELSLVGAPKFKAGDEDILFIRNNGRAIFPLFAIMHGRYPILKENVTKREYVARSNRVPLEDTAEVALPMAEGPAAELQRRNRRIERALTPDEFARKVRDRRQTRLLP